MMTAIAVIMWNIVVSHSRFCEQAVQLHVAILVALPRHRQLEFEISSTRSISMCSYAIILTILPSKRLAMLVTSHFEDFIHIIEQHLQ